MLKRLKFILVCAIVAASTTACSSDDSSSSGSSSGEYTVSVTVTQGATIEQVMAVISEGTDINTDVQTGLETTKWSKVYKKTSKQRIDFTAQGFGVDETSKLNVKVTKDNKVVKEGSGSGTLLSATVTF